METLNRASRYAQKEAGLAAPIYAGGEGVFLCALQVREIVHASSLSEQEHFYQSIRDMLLDQGRGIDAALPVLEVRLYFPCFWFTNSHQ